MENLFQQLKKLRRIEAHADVIKRSREFILTSRQSSTHEAAVFVNAPDATSRQISVWDIILKNFEFGASVALAGALILMIFGGFSAWKLFSPLQLRNLDASGIKAEAQALDIQIQLTKLSYDEISDTARPTVSASETQAPAPVKTRVIKKQPAQVQVPDAPSAPAPSEEPLSVEEALEQLAE